jgi:hypothetical protein
MKEKRSSSTVTMLALGVDVFLLLPLLYALSGGPALWPSNHEVITPATFETFDGPLGKGASAVEMTDALSWYNRGWQ